MYRISPSTSSTSLSDHHASGRCHHRLVLAVFSFTTIISVQFRPRHVWGSLCNSQLSDDMPSSLQLDSPWTTVTSRRFHPIDNQKRTNDPLSSTNPSKIAEKNNIHTVPSSSEKNTIFNKYYLKFLIRLHLLLNPIYPYLFFRPRFLEE